MISDDLWLQTCLLFIRLLSSSSSPSSSCWLLIVVHTKEGQTEVWQKLHIHTHTRRIWPTTQSQWYRNGRQVKPSIQWANIRQYSTSKQQQQPRQKTTCDRHLWTLRRAIYLCCVCFTKEVKVASKVVVADSEWKKPAGLKSADSLVLESLVSLPSLCGKIWAKFRYLNLYSKPLISFKSSRIESQQELVEPARQQQLS